jgi:hypothetical protein
MIVAYLSSVNQPMEQGSPTGQAKDDAQMLDSRSGGIAPYLPAQKVNVIIEDLMQTAGGLQEG